MPEITTKPVFLVDADSDPVVVRIDGRVNFQNCSCLRDFIAEMLRRGKTRFVLDFARCTGMDSTFLGVLAGAAIELKKSTKGGSLVAARLSPSNLELMRNLGLHRLLIVDADVATAGVDQCKLPLECRRRPEIEDARFVLEAHENLVKANEANHAKFQDVLLFLRNRVEQK